MGADVLEVSENLWYRYTRLINWIDSLTSDLRNDYSLDAILSVRSLFDSFLRERDAFRDSVTGDKFYSVFCDSLELKIRMFTYLFDDVLKGIKAGLINHDGSFHPIRAVISDSPRDIHESSITWVDGAPDLVWDGVLCPCFLLSVSDGSLSSDYTLGVLSRDFTGSVCLRELGSDSIIPRESIKFHARLVSCCRLQEILYDSWGRSLSEDGDDQADGDVDGAGDCIGDCIGLGGLVAVSFSWSTDDGVQRFCTRNVKRCPCCGSDHLYSDCTRDSDGLGEVRVLCPSCGISIKTSGVGRGKDLIEDLIELCVKKWDMRVCCAAK